MGRRREEGILFIIILYFTSVYFISADNHVQMKFTGTETCRDFPSHVVIDMDCGLSGLSFSGWVHTCTYFLHIHACMLIATVVLCFCTQKNRRVMYVWVRLEYTLRLPCWWDVSLIAHATCTWLHRVYSCTVLYQWLVSLPAEFTSHISVQIIWSRHLMASHSYPTNWRAALGMYMCKSNEQSCRHIQ